MTSTNEELRKKFWKEFSGIKYSDEVWNWIEQNILQAKQQEEKWISVEERLPENHTDVLVAYENTKTAEWIEYTSFYNDKFESKKQITHWQPLPEPPNSK